MEKLMTAITANTERLTFLRRVLFADAATCVATGALLSIDAGPLSALFGLPSTLLFYAGLSLFPVAAFIAWVASRTRTPAIGVWIVIVGNIIWVIGSAAVLLVMAPSGLGYAFGIAQALIVAVLAELEYMSLGRSKL
jgi:hypothetical protein